MAFKSERKNMKHYTMTDEETKAAIYNWLDQSGSHVFKEFPNFEPLITINGEVKIYFVLLLYNEG